MADFEHFVHSECNRTPHCVLRSLWLSILAIATEKVFTLSYGMTELTLPGQYLCVPLHPKLLRLCCADIRHGAAATAAV